jgi:hypothetical protein
MAAQSAAGSISATRALGGIGIAASAFSAARSTRPMPGICT